MSELSYLLRTSESYVLSNLDQVLQNLYRIEGQHWDRNQDLDYIGLKKSKNLLRKHTKELFNRSNNKHRTEIMVTLPNEAAEDKDLLRDLIKGMAIARINLSHGDVAIWTKMIEHIRKLEKELNRMVKIYIDLAGPKIRPGILKYYPKRERSNLLSPSRPK
ncbi:MAG: pyruvate kinase [Saprospiraceae bacterium]